MTSTHKVYKKGNDVLLHNSEKWGETHTMVFDTHENNYIKALKKAYKAGYISKDYYNGRISGS